jgi:cytochrome c peroxidase
VSARQPRLLVRHARRWRLALAQPGRPPQRALVTLLALTAAACSGGGGGDAATGVGTSATNGDAGGAGTGVSLSPPIDTDSSLPPSAGGAPTPGSSTPSAGSSTPTAPTPVCAAGNRPPELAMAISRLQVIGNHPVHFDASQAGKTFRDPDGDPLTYSVWFLADEVPGPFLSFVPTNVPFPTLGMSGVFARDACGGEARHFFEVELVPNALPRVVRPNSVLFAAVGQHVNHDLAQGGATFADADGDPLVYTVEMTSPAGRGFVVQGTHAVGSAAPLSAASFKITADDGYGGTATDTFIVAIPGPLPGEPTLPATTYAYQDDELSLPFDFHLSVQRLSPFWDTAVTQSNRTTNAGATLGRVLFYDKRLSILNTHSCGSCHEQAHGFATPDRFPTGVQGVPLKRNAMGLANSRYNLNEKYFSDGRAFNLEPLALMPIEDPLELGNLLPVLVEKLEGTSFYAPLFTAAFGSTEVTSERIAEALAQFMRSMLSYRTRFDLAYSRMDDPEAQPPLPPPDPAQFLTPLELRGVQLFTDSGCDTCHATNLQTMGSFFNNGLDLVPLDLGAAFGHFRVASLRNVALTAPYMHDGRFATLREVIEHYDHGVVETEHLSDGLREFHGGPVRRLNLTEQDKNALEAFLHTLTDTTLVDDPKFSDPF